jgi:5'(3')-deoxyribonucleotidase
MARFGDKVYIVSNPSGLPSAASGKMKWMQKYFPRYVSRFFLGSLKEVFSSPDAVLIDDHQANINAFSEAEHPGVGILFPRPWNSLHDKDPIEHLRNCLNRVREEI